MSSSEVLERVTLIDKVTRTKYVLDSTHTNITAIDSSGKQLWQTNPWRKYLSSNTRTHAKQPTIDVFSLNILTYDLTKNYSWTKKDDEVISISYNGHQGPFGVINKKTGEFIYLGMD
ncbi:hypothetical protein GCM10022409_13300 [Hymenobacter glaciei]|uniref:Uncharacterized protein n=2 Tax=Hymenobacter glaciei TaxID=877209 RepID=A0ABP7TS26_9BACT